VRAYRADGVSGVASCAVCAETCYKNEMTIFQSFCSEFLVALCVALSAPVDLEPLLRAQYDCSSHSLLFSTILLSPRAFHEAAAFAVLPRAQPLNELDAPCPCGRQRAWHEDNGHQKHAVMLPICERCCNSLNQSHCPPKFSIANGNWIGEFPFDVTMAEAQMISLSMLNGVIETVGDRHNKKRSHTADLAEFNHWKTGFKPAYETGLFGKIPRSAICKPAYLFEPGCAQLSGGCFFMSQL
jgi:hypothetical protein